GFRPDRARGAGLHGVRYLAGDDPARPEYLVVTAPTQEGSHQQRRRWPGRVIHQNWSHETGFQKYCLTCSCVHSGWSVRVRPKTPPCSIIALSACFQEEQLKAATASSGAGGCAYASKPGRAANGWRSRDSSVSISEASPRSAASMACWAR